MTGCRKPRESTIYGHFTPILSEEWRIGEEQFFAVPVEEEEEIYRVVLLLRTSPRFRLNELMVGMVCESPAHSFRKKVIKVPTSQKKNLPFGGYNLDLYEVVIEEGKIFPETGVYSFSFQHLMSDSIVVGVVEVGLAVEMLSREKNGGNI